MYFCTELKAAACMDYLLFRADREANGTNVPLIIKIGGHVLLRDKLHRSRHMLNRDKHKVTNGAVC